MTWTSRAPLLSATDRKLSCWIMAVLSRSAGRSRGTGLQNLDEAEALGCRQRARLDDRHHVAFLRLVALIVRTQLGRTAQHLAVQRMTLDALDEHRDGLVALVADDATDDAMARRLLFADRKSTRLHSSPSCASRMPSS